MFQDRLDDLFDIAHRDAVSLIKIEEDRLFLEAQREKGRRGTIAGVDRNLTLKKKRVMKRKTSAAKYAAKIKRAVVTPSDSVNITTKRPDNQEGDDYDDGSSSDSSSLNLLSDPMEGPSTSKPRVRGKVNLITPKVAAALDRTKTSDRKAAYIFSAMASSGQLQCNTEDVVICPSAIRRARMKHREVFSAEVKATFDPVVPLILHWGGKIIEDITSPGKKKVDRLPILVSGQNVVKLLYVPKLCNGTAVKMSEAVIDCLDEWGLRDRIKGMCFDTTASNAGTKGGVCLGPTDTKRNWSEAPAFSTPSSYFRDHAGEGVWHAICFKVS